MKNDSVRWRVSLFAFLCWFSNSAQACYQSASFPSTDENQVDNPLVLSDDELEHLVSMTGKLRLDILNRDPEDSAQESPICRPILKLCPESFEIACSTPVRASFQTPDSIRSFRNCDEIALTGNYDKKWIDDHIDQIVTVEGYLWHAHTGHHLTPILMDSEPWPK